jgi:hypothetical protein
MPLTLPNCSLPFDPHPQKTTTTTTTTPSYIEGEFRKDHIYTRTGAVLVAVNPFKWMIPHYADPIVVK